MHAWGRDKATAWTSAKCALMSTYVDDCSMDGKKGLSNTQWDVIRMLFVSDDPEFAQRIVGITRADLTMNVEIYTVSLSQAAYLENFLAELLAEWKPVRAVRANGQSTPALVAADLEPKACPAIVRSILGALMYAARCTRPDLSFPVNRMVRYRWTGGRTSDSTKSSSTCWATCSAARVRTFASTPQETRGKICGSRPSATQLRHAEV